MSGLHFLLVWAKPRKTRLVISDGIVVGIANERVGKVRFSYFLDLYFRLSSRNMSVMLIAERLDSKLWQ